MPADFRGPEMPPLAQRVAAGRPVIDAAAIGRAVTGGLPGPPTADGDDPGSESQQLKYLWHTLLAHGRAP